MAIMELPLGADPLGELGRDRVDRQRHSANAK